MLACFIILLAAIGPFVGGWVAFRLAESLVRRDRTRGHCLACGYDRVGLSESELCPECGLNAAAAEATLVRRGWLYPVLPLVLGVSLCVLFIVIGQPLTGGEEAWACLCVLVPSAILALLAWLPRFGRRSWVRWTVLALPLASMLAIMVPAYLNLAADQRPAPYGRGFWLQVTPLVVGVLCINVAGWGIALCSLVLAACLRVSLKRPDIGPPSTDRREEYTSPW